MISFTMLLVVPLQYTKSYFLQKKCFLYEYFSRVKRVGLYFCITALCKRLVLECESTADFWQHPLTLFPIRSDFVDKLSVYENTSAICFFRNVYYTYKYFSVKHRYKRGAYIYWNTNEVVQFCYLLI